MARSRAAARVGVLGLVAILGWPGCALESFSTPSPGSVLPFPATPTASVAKRTLQQSTMKRRARPEHLRRNAPNILIVLVDDVGFGIAATMYTQ